MIDYDNDFYKDLIANDDTFVKMKCTTCNYEENAPDWVLDELADMNRSFDTGFKIPTIICPNCNNPTLIRFTDYEKLKDK